MLEYEILTEGDKEIIKFFEQFPDLAQKETKAFVNRALFLLQNRAADYPPAIPGSSYRRTGTLGRLWTTARHEFKEGPSYIEGRIGNRTPYGPYVQSEAQQAAVHKGRWKTIEQIIEDSRADIDKLLSQSGRNLEKEYKRRTE